MKIIEVVAAIIKKENKILVTQRGYGGFAGKWEFPGGKIEQNESKEEALVREIKEELEADIKIDEFLCTIDYDYDEFHLTMHCYFSSLISENISLVEHQSAKWVSIEELDEIDWIEADVEVVEMIKLHKE